MKVVKADRPVFNDVPVQREGELVSYGTMSHRRHIVTHDSVTTLDNEEVHHAIHEKPQTIQARVPDGEEAR